MLAPFSIEGASSKSGAVQRRIDGSLLALLGISVATANASRLTGRSLDTGRAYSISRRFFADLLTGFDEKEHEQLHRYQAVVVNILLLLVGIFPVVQQLSYPTLDSTWLIFVGIGGSADGMGKQVLEQLEDDMPTLDDEILPVTPADEATPFIFKPAERTNSLFKTFLYPTQGGVALPNLAGELRGLYGAPGALAWHPEWSQYLAKRPPAKTHWGVDIFAPVGTEIVAVCDGELSYAQQANGLGLYAKLKITVGGKAYEFHYGHLQGKSGEARSVPMGEVIGFAGCSGNAGVDGICTAPPGGLGFSSSHVHFALLPPQTTGAPKRSNPLTVLGWTLAEPNRPASL